MKKIVFLSLLAAALGTASSASAASRSEVYAGSFSCSEGVGRCESACRSINAARYRVVIMRSGTCHCYCGFNSAAEGAEQAPRTEAGAILNEQSGSFEEQLVAGLAKLAKVKEAPKADDAPKAAEASAAPAARSEWACSAYCWGRNTCYAVYGYGSSRVSAFQRMQSSCGGALRMDSSCYGSPTPASACSN